MATGENTEIRPLDSGLFISKPPPQFGEFQHEGFHPRPNQVGPHVLVRNTFLDVDDRPQTPPALIRARTTPPGYPAASALPPKKDSGLSLDADEDDEEEEADGPVPATPSSAERAARHTTRETLEPREAWSWVGRGGQAAAVPGQLPSPRGGGRVASSPLGGAVGQATGPAAAAPAQLAAGQPILYSAPGQPMPMQQVQMVMMPMDFASGVPVLMGTDGSGMPVSLPQQGARGAAPTRWPASQQEYLAQQQPLLPQQQQQQALQPHPPPVPQQPQQQAPLPARPRQADSIHVESPTDPSTAIPDGMYHGAGMLAQLACEEAGGMSPVPPQPQTLTRAWSVNSNLFRVHWTVDARKLRGNDKQAVSPPFELNFGEQFPKVTFKMMIYPKVMNESKGGASFKKAKGRGYVQLKCEAELQESIANVSFRISIGSGDNLQPPRGPVSHNFSSSAVCGLPKEEEEWDFSTVVDQESMTFVVCLEIVPTPPRR